MRRFHTCVCSTLHLPSEERRTIERLVASASVRDGHLVIDHPTLSIEPQRHGYAVHVGVVENNPIRPAGISPQLWNLLTRALNGGATWLSFDCEELPEPGLPIVPDEEEPIAAGPSRSRVTIRCGTCRGDNVMRDAWARWDEAAQEWVLGSVFDAAYCENCETDATLIEQPLMAIVDKAA